MENISNSTRHDLICPITLDIYRDPVRASDGQIYERNAIIRWIQQQGTSPITREPLDINDLHSEENLKELCRPCRSNSLTHSCQTTVTITASETHTEQPKYCNIKRLLLVIIIISFIITPFIIATTVILFLVQYNSNSSTFASTHYPNNYRYPLTTYKFPNNCTLPTIVPLFFLSNVNSFNYTYYAKLYKSISTQTILTFAFRHDPSYWCVDNVSVIDLSNKSELIINGNFENNPSDGFFRCDLFGNNLTTSFMTSSYPYKDKRSFCDGSAGFPDYLSQKLNTKIGRVYLISFWLQNLGDAPNSAQVVMSY